MMKAAIPPTKAASAAVDPANIEEQVRARAYELFEARRRETGHELEDWLRAEERVAGQNSRASAA